MYSNASMPNSVPQSERAKDAEKVLLNEILQQCLKRLQKGTSVNMIVRCEQLPLVKADRASMAIVFDNVLKIIMSDRPPGNRLFLHVDCEEEVQTEVCSTLGFKRYAINFYTHSNSGKDWDSSKQKMISESRSILAQYDADLIVNEKKSIGCLFTISLLGKTETCLQ